jgi:DNA-binding transcriptional MerR regulator
MGAMVTRTSGARADRAFCAMQTAYWKVGELAKQTGLTVRTLHYYDEIGLLSPACRTEAGYRLYSPADIARLQQITSLRQIGFPLQAIADWLERPDFSAVEVVRLQIERLREQIEWQETLCRQLEAVAAKMATDTEVTAGEFIEAIERMRRMEQDVLKYYTPEQMEQIKARGQQIGAERIRQVEAEWPALIAEVKAEMEAGTDPAGPKVQALMRRWQGLVEEFTGGDPGISQALGKMYQQEPGVRQMAGIDTAVFEYVGKAMAAGKQAE